MTRETSAIVFFLLVGAVPVVVALFFLFRKPYTPGQWLLYFVDLLLVRVLWRAELPSCLPIPEGQGAGDLELARMHAQSAIDDDPTLLLGYFGLIEVALKEKDFEEALELLKQIDQRFTLEFGGLERAPAYAEFVKSPQYQQWRSYLESNGR